MAVLLMRWRQFRLEAMVLLPDHLHLVLTLPPGDGDFRRGWRRSEHH
jgi:putative transposase